MSSARPNPSLNLTGLRKRTNPHQRIQSSSPSKTTTTTSSSSSSSYSIIDNPASTRISSTDMEKSPISEDSIPVHATEEVPEEPTSSDDSTAESPVSAREEEDAGGVDEEEDSGIPNTTKSNPKPARRVRLSPPRVDTNQPRRRDHPTSPISPTTRAWYEFDLAVVVALVSPVGNWLTGGDHVKNLILVTLLIFYLHQIIEVPWTLYHACRPRHKPHSSTLHGLELFFLTLTVISPLLGALLLRTVGKAIVGPDALSWFNVTLFVLATGLRPWRHLVLRMTEAAEEIQGVICEGDCGGTGPSYEDLHNEAEAREVERDKQTDLLMHRLEALEKELQKVKTKMSVRQEEVYDYVDEAVEDVDKRIREAESRLVKTMHDVDQVGAYLRRNYTTPYLEIFPRWIMRTLSLPFTGEGSRVLDTTEMQHRDTHALRGPSSVSTLRTMSIPSSSKSAMKSTASHHTSHYASPCASTKSGHSKSLYPIPEEDVGVVPSPSQPHSPYVGIYGKAGLPSPASTTTTIIMPSASLPSGAMGYIGSLVFMPFRVVRGVLSWGLGYV